MFKNVLMLALAFFLSVGVAFADGTYLLKAGDSLNVSVWGEETLQKEAIVLPDGSITFPLAGRIPVVGYTAAQVEKKLTENLKNIFTRPSSNGSGIRHQR